MPLTVIAEAMGASISHGLKVLRGKNLGNECTILEQPGTLRRPTKNLALPSRRMRSGRVRHGFSDAHAAHAAPARRAVSDRHRQRVLH